MREGESSLDQVDYPLNSIRSVVLRSVDRVKRSGFGGLVRATVRRAFRPAVVPAAATRLQSAARRAKSVDAVLDVAYGFRFAGIAIEPWQVRSEIRRLLEILRERRPRTILEIGTSTGGSLFLFAQVAAPDALLVSVDLPKGEFGGGYPRWRSFLYHSFARDGQRVELLRADSHDPHTRACVRKLLRGRELDFLFVDGDHTYQGVRRDFEMYGGLVRDGGVIAFHDIIPPAADADACASRIFQSGEVHRFWREIRQAYPSEELVENWERGAFGIGVLEAWGNGGPA